MWNIDTAWFDVAVVGTAFAVGNVLFGRFVEFRPRWRRLLKLALVLALTVGLARTAGRAWAYGWMVLPAIFAAWIHLVWLPRRGINGWTAEPRDQYLELVKQIRLRDILRGNA